MLPSISAHPGSERTPSAARPDERGSMPALRARRLGTFALVLVAVIGAAGCTEFRKNRHLKRGDAYYAEKKYKEAMLEYRNVLRFEKENPHAIARLGLANFSLGDWAQAYAFLNKAKDLTPEDTEVRLRLGAMLLQAKQRDKARENAEFVLTKDPNSLAALTLMADTSDSVEELDSAIAAIEEKKSSLGDPVKVGRVLGMLYLAKRDVPKAEEAFKRAVEASPQSAEARISLASLHQAKGEVEQAELEFKAAANAEPQDPAGKLRLADFYLQQKKPDDARRILGEITSKNPDYLPAWLRTAEIAVAERKWDDALKALEPVFKKNPDERTGLMIRGQVELAKSQSSEAIQTYRQVLKTNAKYAPAHYQLAVAHIQNADPEQAKRSCARPLRLTPTYADAIFLLADLNIQSGSLDPAIDDLKKFVEQFPKVPPGPRASGSRLPPKERAREGHRGVPQDPGVGAEGPPGSFTGRGGAAGRRQGRRGAKASRGGRSRGASVPGPPGPARGHGPGRQAARGCGGPDQAGHRKDAPGGASLLPSWECLPVQGRP